MFEVLRVGPGRLCLGRCTDNEAGWAMAVELVKQVVGDKCVESATNACSIPEAAPVEQAVAIPDLASGMQEREVPATEAPPA